VRGDWQQRQVGGEQHRRQRHRDADRRDRAADNGAADDRCTDHHGAHDGRAYDDSAHDGRAYDNPADNGRSHDRGDHPGQHADDHAGRGGRRGLDSQPHNRHDAGGG